MTVKLVDRAKIAWYRRQLQPGSIKETVDVFDAIVADGDHGSPRVSSMIALVSRPLPACPRSFAKRLGGCFFAAWTRTTLPSEVRRKSILLPGTIPKRSRTGLGIVICPLAVTVVVMIGTV